LASPAPDHSGRPTAAAQQHSSSVFHRTIVSVQPETDEGAGKAEADLAAQEGFNTLRVIMPWSYPSQAEAKNDKDRVCSVAKEASALHLGLLLDLSAPPNVSPPKPPVTSTQIRQYITTLGAYMSYIIGPKGCAQGLSELGIQVWNESDSGMFWPQATAAQDYTHLLIRTWRSVHKEAAAQGYTVPVYVIGGDLTSSHHPDAFIAAMAAEAQAWHMHGPFFDEFAYHCYGTNGTAFTPPDTVRAALEANIGQDIPLMCSEYAAINASAKQYCQAEAMAVSSGLTGFGWFRLLDDPVGDQTGIFHYDKALGQLHDQAVVKVPLAGVGSFNAAALSGDLACT
jgi:hypothetical protein